MCGWSIAKSCISQYFNSKPSCSKISACNAKRKKKSYNHNEVWQVSKLKQTQFTVPASQSCRWLSNPQTSHPPTSTQKKLDTWKQRAWWSIVVVIPSCVLFSLNLLFLNILADYFDSTGEPLKTDIFIYFMHLKQAPWPTASATRQPNPDFTSSCQFYLESEDKLFSLFACNWSQGG